MSEQTADPAVIPDNTQSVTKILSHAWVAHVKGDHATAESEFSKVLESDPDSTDALYGYGLTQKMLGNKEKAIVSFQKALDILAKEANTEKSSRVPMLRYLTQSQLKLLSE